jgi:tetratricopeptide (TPR) repeat protein
MMTRKIISFHLTVIGFLLLTLSIYGQSLRSLNNDGVDSYKKQQYVDAEVNFKKGLEKSKESFELNYNLGDAYYKQQRYDEAIKSFQNSLTFTEDGSLKSKVFHNIGNSLLKSQKVKESVEAYKNSLKLNPSDKDTKYNLSYALSLLKNQQNQQQQNQNKQNQDKQDQNKNDQQDKQQKQQPKNQDQTAQQDNMKQAQNKISKEEAERILEALKNNEKDLQKKLRKKVGVPVTTDKDW